MRVQRPDPDNERVADSAPDLESAAMACLASRIGAGWELTHTQIRHLTRDGYAIRLGGWGTPSALQPELREHIARHIQGRIEAGAGPDDHLFIGSTGKRISRPRIRRILGSLDWAESLWSDDIDPDLDPAGEDGCEVLRWIDPWALWPDNATDTTRRIH